MTVLHSTGTLDIEQGDIVSKMSGTRGLFKKERWEQEERVAIASIEAILITEGIKGDLTLGFKSNERELPRAFTYCQPAEEIEVFLTILLQANPLITVTNVDIKADSARVRQAAYAIQAKVARVRQAQEDAGNEIIGVTRRGTVTRLLLLGPVGALIFKKRDIVRRKDAK